MLRSEPGLVLTLAKTIAPIATSTSVSVFAARRVATLLGFAGATAHCTHGDPSAIVPLVLCLGSPKSFALSGRNPTVMPSTVLPFLATDEALLPAPETALA